MDLYNGEIIAYRMAKRPVFDLVSNTLREAIARSE
ncbi:MAG: integrase core domain protein, partial [Polaromonas sp.]|nr:integrase core domain protein [Polaromonas sp.]